jgi:hypothetical protein
MEGTVTGLFDTFDDGYSTMESLVSNGYSRGDISFISRDPRSAQSSDETSTDGNEVHDTPGDSMSGAATGAAIGGGMAAVAILPALVIPVIGPIVALGAIAAGLSIGGGAGGVIGTLNSTGVPKEKAEAYVDRIRNGGALVSVKVADERSSAYALEIMGRYKPVETH